MHVDCRLLLLPVRVMRQHCDLKEMLHCALCKIEYIGTGITAVLESLDTTPVNNKNDNSSQRAGCCLVTRTYILRVVNVGYQSGNFLYVLNIYRIVPIIFSDLIRKQ